MSLAVASAEEHPPPSLSLADSSLANPIVTPSCSTFSSRTIDSFNYHLPKPSLSISRDHPDKRNPAQSCFSNTPARTSPGLTRVHTPAASANRSPALTRAGTPDSCSRKQTSKLRVSTPDYFSTSSTCSSRGSSFRSRETHHSERDSGGEASSSTLCEKVNQAFHLRSSPRSCQVCPSPRKTPPINSIIILKDRRLATWNPQQQLQNKVEPYARRKSDPQGYLFTCYLDYSRSIPRPSPTSFCECYVRPESLQYSSYPLCSVTDTPRSSCSSLSQRSTPLYSRPPTPPPLSRSKEIHRTSMAGAPVDVTELPHCYIFVAEVPGLKNTEVKVQVENDSVLKITGEKKREECNECEIKYIRLERQAGKFQRKFNLPPNADLDCITAACQDGLLSVVVPKNPPPERHRPKTFEVKIDA